MERRDTSLRTGGEDSLKIEINLLMAEILLKHIEISKLNDKLLRLVRLDIDEELDNFDPDLHDGTSQ